MCEHGKPRVSTVHTIRNAFTPVEGEQDRFCKRVRCYVKVQFVINRAWRNAENWVVCSLRNSFYQVNTRNKCKSVSFLIVAIHKTCRTMFQFARTLFGSGHGPRRTTEIFFFRCSSENGGQSFWSIGTTNICGTPGTTCTSAAFRHKLKLPFFAKYKEEAKLGHDRDRHASVEITQLAFCIHRILLGTTAALTSQCDKILELVWRRHTTK